jgi:hypothetical protein
LGSVIITALLMEKKMRKAVFPLLAALVFSVGHSGMSYTEYRLFTGKGQFFPWPQE